MSYLITSEPEKWANVDKYDVKRWYVNHCVTWAGVDSGIMLIEF